MKSELRKAIDHKDSHMISQHLNEYSDVMNIVAGQGEIIDSVGSATELILIRDTIIDGNVDGDFYEADTLKLGL